MNNILCKIISLTKKFENDQTDNAVIDNLNLDIIQGEILSLIAPSGYGKTTFLNLLAGIDTPTAGDIKKGGNLDIGYMFQQEVLLPWRNVLNNVLLGVEIKGKDIRTYRKLGINLLRRFGLDGVEKLYPHELSGGMHQRVALIQNLLFEPELLLLDEPFSSLDYVHKLRLEIEIYQHIKSKGMTAILVTHDIEEAITVSDRILLFQKKPLSEFEEFPVILEDRTDPSKVRRSQVFLDLFAHFWRFFEEKGEIGFS
jgi:NitT/TauT family transport system ATP-binding protein